MKTYPLTLIDKECSVEFDVDIDAMHSRTRTQPVVDARQAAMWFADLDDNYPHRIADFWGCTVSNVKASIQSAANKLRTEKKYRFRMNMIGERLIKQTCNPPETLLQRHD